MRVKTEARRKAYIQAAGKLFIEQGFAAVYMEAIAAEVGGSKVTLYNYFPSKEALFEAFVVEAGLGAVEKLGETPPEGQPLSTTLTTLGLAYLRLVTRPEVIALDRLIIGEAKRQPQLTRIFFENGPKRTFSALIDVIAECMRRSQIQPGDARAVALHFKGLCEAGVIEPQLWGLDPEPTDAKLVAAVDAAVAAFMNGYAMAPAPAPTRKRAGAIA
jgi:TetR/AcrR family transcriptional repressor of mexJK operon